MELVPRVGIAEGFRARVATLDDIPAVLAVEVLAQPAPWTEAVVRNELQLAWSHAWVVEPHGLHSRDSAALPSICAFLIFWVVHDEVHVLNIAVHPEARRRALAMGLMEDLIEKAEVARMSVITLEVRAGNDAARGLYDGLGFRVIGRRPRYYTDSGEDAVVMARVLNG